MKLLVGFDEAGRGPLAGPVSAACVILPPDFPLELLNDSKKLSEKKRNIAKELIIKNALWGHAFVDHKTIDQINILKASLLAMKLSFDDMEKRFENNVPEWAGDSFEKLKEEIEGIADGTFVPEVLFPCRAEPKADGNYPCVMAASIIAKTFRDDYMVEMDKLYPEYGYKKHKGYPTKMHREVCKRIGPSPIQRLTFTVK